jgi:hypothetical protein
MKQRATIEELRKREQDRLDAIQRYRFEHPVLSGIVKMVDYVAPKGEYRKAV